MTACSEMAAIADTLADRPPRDLLVELGYRVAGIPCSGPMVLPTLLAGGRTRLVGGGFRPELRDHSAAQTRHFAGIARAVTVLGGRRTTWISEHVRRDAAVSPDGRLTALAVDFAEELLDGSVACGDAGAWIRTHVCGR
jgi:hypothetical protein